MTCRVVPRPDRDRANWPRVAQRVLKASLLRQALEIDLDGRSPESIRGALRHELEPRGYRVHIRRRRRSVVAWADQPGAAGASRLSRTRSGR